MVNLGLCQKCPRCTGLSPATLDGEGNKLRRTTVECMLSGTQEILGWGSNVPEGCPFVLEHTVSQDSITELSDEETEEDEDTEEDDEARF